MAKKVKSLYVCTECGYQSAKWLGKCPSCGAWNSMQEVIQNMDENKSSKRRVLSENLLNFSKIKQTKIKRIKTGISEFDRVLGGGTVPGSIILIGGEPGIGKSTLLLQVSNKFGEFGKVLYVSGEESPEQIKLRADRLGIDNPNIYILPETDVNAIVDHIANLKPISVIIDSIQTINNPDLYNVTGSVSQIRDSTSQLLKVAKDLMIPIFIIGHITKEGSIAGPKSLEHIVDVVLYMEGERFHSFRLLRSYKNRFGSTYEVGVFEMGEKGMVEVNNPASYFLDGYENRMPGAAISTVMEGTRPLMIELQALVVSSNMPYPRRVVEGTDYNKVLLITAVLEKLVGINIGNYEIYLKVVGGIKIKEPAIDLGIAAAILSSYNNKEISKNTVFIGEIGLTGEIRSVPYIEQRLNEAIKIGFKNIIVPRKNIGRNYKNINGVKIIGLSYIKDIFEYI